ncbi:MAG: DUF3800 domain-containing protein [Verrucomicrobia bacterium]|nr:DUF3800 domain-containing protein [Verrucomicrobiota bacterium]
MKIFNIYCDESCHLENDQQQVMLLGAVWCPSDLSRSIAKRLKAIKKKHDLSPTFEIKWTKVSPAKIDFYMDILSYFFEESGLYFRALIIPDKTKLRHDAFNHDHDTWYYKMYFEMLKVLLNPHDRYHIYLDIKDSKSGEKVAKLHDVLCNNAYDFQRQIIERVQTVRSHEIEQLQLADLLIGCVLAANRNSEISGAKKALVEKMRQLSGYCLTRTTLIRERKVNLIRWQASEVSNG